MADPASSPSFFQRLGMAFGAFSAVLGDAGFAARFAALRSGAAAPAPAPATARAQRSRTSAAPR